MSGTSIEAIEKLVRSTALDKSSIVGATVVTTRAVHDENLMDLDSYLVIDVYSSDCEIRKVTGRNDRDYILASALSNAHEAGAPVLVLDSLDVNAKYYGAVGDGVTDDSTAIQAALDAADGGIFRLPKGIYGVGSTLTLPQAIILFCSPAAELKAIASMDKVVEMSTRDYDVQQININNLRIDANSLATSGVELYKISMSNFTAINGLFVKNATGAGAVFQACQGGLFQSIKVVDSGRGIDILGCNSARFLSISAGDNTGDGVRISTFDDPVHYGGGCTVFGLHSENNGGHGVVISTETLTTVTGGWLEGNLDGFQLNGTGAVIEKCVIGGDENYVGVRIGAAAVTATVRNNTFGGALDKFARIIVTGGATGTFILGPNYRNNGSTFHPQETRGAASSVADGGTIAHGITGTPTVAIVTGSVAGEFVSVTGLDATNITVAIKKHDNSAGTSQTIYWRAYIEGGVL